MEHFARSPSTIAPQITVRLAIVFNSHFNAKVQPMYKPPIFVQFGSVVSLYFPHSSALCCVIFYVFCIVTKFFTVPLAIRHGPQFENHWSCVLLPWLGQDPFMMCFYPQSMTPEVRCLIFPLCSQLWRYGVNRGGIDIGCSLYCLHQVQMIESKKRTTLHPKWHSHKSDSGHSSC